MKTLATELIAYQNGDRFPDQLKDLIERIYDEIDAKTYKGNKELLERSAYPAKIEKLIKDRFNLTVLFDKELAEYLPAAIVPFMSDYLTEASTLNRISSSTFGSIFGGTNIFKHVKQLTKEKEAYFKRIHNRRGFVDRKNARVGGYLADVRNYLILNFYTLRGEDLTPDEMVDIVLHELGHAFVGLETHHRLSTTNSTIAGILDDLNNHQTDRAYYVFKKTFEPKDLDKAALGGQKEITDFYGKLATTYLGELSSQMHNAKYDETNYENLADSFANRFNRGKHLVSGLHKLHLKYGAVQESRSLYATLLFLDILSNALLLVLCGWYGAVLAAFLVFVVCNDSATTMTYDFPRDRYNRIKNGIVHNLKNPHLPKALVKDLLTQYRFIDEVVEKSMEFKGVLPYLADYILPNNRENNYYRHLQTNIENSLNSILFVKSAELSIVS